MRLLCYADLQATDGSEVCFTYPLMTLQQYRVDKFFRDVKKLYKEHDCDGIIDLGDTTDDRSSIPVPTIDLIGTGLDRLPASDLNFKLTGNHEQYMKNCEINNRSLFKHRFNVIDASEVYELGEYVAFFCSFPASHSDLVTWIGDMCQIYKGRKLILFGHFQVAGSVTAAGTSLKGIPKECLDMFQLVLLGHVHTPQTFGSKDQIHYIGSPFQQNWGESGEEKRVAILDLEEDINLYWIPMPGYPQYKSVSFNDFKEKIQEESEDRYKVMLASHNEAEEFYAHPSFHKAEPVYNYNQVTTLTAQQVEEKDWSFESFCKEYIKKVPPTIGEVQIEVDEMLQIGIEIAKGS